MSVREGDDPVLYARVQEQNLLRQYDLLTNCIEIGLRKGIEAFDKYTLWALNAAAVSNIAQFGGRFREQPIYVGNHLPPHFKDVPTRRQPTAGEPQPFYPPAPPSACHHRRRMALRVGELDRSGMWPSASYCDASNVMPRALAIATSARRSPSRSPTAMSSIEAGLSTELEHVNEGPSPPRT